MTMTTLSKPISARKPDQHKYRTDWTARREWWRHEARRCGTDWVGILSTMREAIAWVEGAPMTTGEYFEPSSKKGRGMAQRSIDLIEAMHTIVEAAQPITSPGVG
jgi:hypothetical protein